MADPSFGIEQDVVGFACGCRSGPRRFGHRNGPARQVTELIKALPLSAQAQPAMPCQPARPGTSQLFRRPTPLDTPKSSGKMADSGRVAKDIGAGLAKLPELPA